MKPKMKPNRHYFLDLLQNLPHKYEKVLTFGPYMPLDRITKYLSGIREHKAIIKGIRMVGSNLTVRVQA